MAGCRACLEPTSPGTRRRPAPPSSTSTSYTVDLDLTDLRHDLRTTTDDRASPAREPGAETFADLVGATIHEITLNGDAARPGRRLRRQPDPADDLQADNELRVFGRLPLHPHRRGSAPLRRPGRRPGLPLHASSRCPTPAASSRPSSSPTSRASFTFHVTAPAHWVVVSNAPTPEPEAARRRQGRSGDFPATKRMSTYITALVAGEYHAVHDTYSGKHGEIPLGHYCRQSLVEHLDTDELVEDHQAGLRVLRGGLRLPLPVRQVRPALRAGVQHGRDGERRRA